MQLRTSCGWWHRDRHQRRRSESNRRIEVLQTSALPLGYGATTHKLAIYLDFLNPPLQAPLTSVVPQPYSTAESRTAEIAGLLTALEECALSQESMWGFLWVVVVRQTPASTWPSPPLRLFAAFLSFPLG